MLRFAAASVLFIACTAPPAGSAPPEPLDLDAFAYSTPEVRQRLERFFDIARRAGDGGAHQILSTAIDRRDFIAVWCKTVNHKGDCLIYRAANMESVHGISIHASHARVQRPTLNGFTLEAHRQASPQAWAVGMYYVHGGQFFQLQLGRNQSGGPPPAELVFPVRYFNHVVEFEGVAHAIDIRIPNPHAGRNWDAELPQILSSPEALRDAMLADLDRLERDLQQPLLALGAAGIRETRSRTAAKKMRFVANETLPNLNFRERAPSSKILTESHHRELRELVRVWIESRRALVRDQAEAIHRDTVATFPIAKCLEPRR